MKPLDLIRYIAQHPNYSEIFLDNLGVMTQMQAISELASIDPSHYDSKLFKVSSHDKTLYCFFI